MTNEALMFILIAISMGGGIFLFLNLRLTRSKLAEADQRKAVLETELAVQNEKCQTAIEAKSQLETQLNRDKTELTQQIKALDSELRKTTDRATALNINFERSSEEISELKRTVITLRSEKETLAKNLAALEQQEPNRIAKYDERLTRLNQSQLNLENERERDRLAREKVENDRLQALRETWSRHEAEVEQKMRLICQELAIDYIDKEKFPFSGKPDNSVKICNEYIVFDGKSPQGDDLSNFPTYIRTQAEQAKKYSKHEEVKKDIFLVVPTNAIQAINETYIAQGAHRVHVVTIDSLKPVLMQLKRIEEYEFAEKLSPEDREKIVTIIGKMAHGMKRRVQIDHFFSNEFISILTDAENLPTDILEGAREVERSSKLNPQLHTRSKRIELGSLQKDSEKLAGKVAGQEIHTGPELKTIAALPLHKNSFDDSNGAK